MARKMKIRKIIKPAVRQEPANSGRTPARAMPAAMSEQCATCRHWSGATNCRAFPSGIPKSILKGKFDHRRSYPNDRGLRYTPCDNAGC